MKKINLFVIAVMVFALAACKGANKAPAFIDSSVAGRLVCIPAGSFTMGSDDTSNYGAQPTHKVTLSAFYLGQYQVTQEQYQAVMGTNPSYFLGDEWLPDTGEVQEKRPVETVSWYDALVFCNRLSILEGLTPAYSMKKSDLSGTSGDPAEWGTVPSSADARWSAVTVVPGSDGYRLPTEAQWEYACRAGTTTLWYTGNTEDADFQAAAWHISNSNDMTHEVGKKTPNAWGLYDMHGNVYEWCWDWRGSYSGEAQTDPLGASSGSLRVIRGGNKGSLAPRLRSAARSYDYPYYRSNCVGFRVARS